MRSRALLMVFIPVLFVFCGSGPSWSDDPPGASENSDDRAAIAKWEGLERQWVATYAKVQAAVVCTVAGVGGSGVVVSADGLVLTVSHVVKGPVGQKLTLTFGDGRQVNARKLGFDVTSDMAMLRITDPGPWPFVELGNSSTLAPGTWCMSVGYPSHAASGPPLLRVGRILGSSPWWVAADALSEFGDCGGPIFDEQGRVVAINKASVTSMRGTSHIAIDAYRDAWSRLVKGDRIANPTLLQIHLPTSLGVTPAHGAERAEVGTVLPGSDAERAGLKAGDVFVEFGGEKIADFVDLCLAIQDLGLADHLKKPTVKVRRGDSEVSLVFVVNGSGRIPAYQLAQNLIDGNSWLNNHPEVERHQRNGSGAISSLNPSVAAASRSTVSVFLNGQHHRLGTIIHPAGYIATAAGDWNGKISCRAADGQQRVARLVSRHDKHGFVLLKVDAEAPLPAVEWAAATTPEIGTIVAVVHPNAAALAFGVISSPPRSLSGDLEYGLNLNHSLQVKFLVKGCVGESAGLRSGDRILQVNGQETASLAEFRQILGQHIPGASLNIRIERHRTNESPQGPLTLSLSALGVDRAILHDAAIGKTHWGGPVVNIQGHVVGINVCDAHGISIGMATGEVVREALQRAMPPQ